MAHAALGAALEKKGDRRRALEEYRAAYTLDPKNADVKRAYERLSQPSSPLPNAVPGAALFVAYRTSRHQQYSTPEVFGNIADQIALFLKSHNVALLNDATGRNISTESAPSVYNLVSQVRSAGGGSLILLTVDRPETSWVKLQVQCYDTSGQLLWEESTADSGWGHRGAAGVRNAIEKMEERLALRLGQAGMPTK
jgi:tetratricopeptide (TPR) repeat protein